MMDQEEYEDYLVDKAKEMLNQQLETDDEEVEKPEMRVKRNEMDEKAEKDSTSEIPVAWDPQEIQHLVNNRKKMDNEELQDFLKKDSELHEDLKEFGEWKGFTRWEERFIIQNHQVKKPAELAEELERENQEVKLKMRMMGINFEDNDRQG